MTSHSLPRLLLVALALVLAIPGSASAAKVKIGVHQAEFAPGPVPPLLAQTESSAIRTDLSWSEVQPCTVPSNCASSPFDWTATDARFLALSQAGVGPEFLTLIQAPDWAAAQSCKQGSICTPARRYLPQWRKYVRQVLLRYGPKGSFWESIDAPASHRIQNFVLWNEANHDKDWNGDASYQQYAALLAQTRSVFDASASTANLNAGNVAYGDTSTAPPSWLRGLITKTDAERDFEILTIHPYSRTPRAVLAKAKRAQALHGVRRLAITEIGWGIDDTGTGPTSSKCVRTVAEQAANLRKTFELVTTGVRELKWLFWFNGVDKDTSGGCNKAPDGKTFGLFEGSNGDPAFAEKPSLAEFKEFAPVAGG